jgi:hypothetical protein
MIMFIAGLIFLGSLIWIAVELKRISEARDEFVKIRKGLTIKKLLGWGLLIFGGTHLILPELKFLAGVFAMPLSIISVVAGLAFLYNYYQPKIAESLSVAERTNGYLTLVVLMRRLGLTQKLGMKTLRRMVKDDLVLVLNPDPVNPKDQKITKMILLVRGFSGRLPGTSENTAASSATPTTDDEIRDQHSHVTERGVDDINRMILEGTLDLGRSGRPL